MHPGIPLLNHAPYAAAKKIIARTTREERTGAYVRHEAPQSAENVRMRVRTYVTRQTKIMRARVRLCVHEPLGGGGGTDGEYRNRNRTRSRARVAMPRLVAYDCAGGARPASGPTRTPGRLMMSRGEEKDGAQASTGRPSPRSPALFRAGRGILCSFPSPFPMIRHRLGFRRWLMRGSPLAPSSLLYARTRWSRPQQLRDRRGRIIGPRPARFAR